MAFKGFISVLTMILMTAAQDIIFPDEEPLPEEISHRAILGGFCFTPEGRRGTCLNPRLCSYFLPLIHRAHDRRVLSYLRKHICGKEGNTFHMCCPSASQRQDQNSQQFAVNKPTQPERRQPASLPPASSAHDRQSGPTIECGSQLTTRIIKGVETQPGEFPWLAAIGISTRTGFLASCGGTLVSSLHVLSAAHCMQPSEGSKPSHVRLGDFDLSTSTDPSSPVTRRISREIYSDYDRFSTENDIVLLLMDRDVAYNKYIIPACIPEKFRYDTFSGQTLEVAGWGKTESGSLSPVLLKASVPVVDLDQCIRLYRSSRLLQQPSLDSRNLCAGIGQSDACQGDSGSPLLHLDLNEGKYYIVGVVSFGVGCARAEFPGVYTRVGAFIDWINQNVK